jgi:3-oxoadipate enol-lactonase
MVRYLESRPPAGVRPRGLLVLLHAFPLNSAMWNGQLPLSSGGWHIVAPDFRGMNGGEGDRAASSVDDYAGDVVDLLDSLHVKEAVIAGLSVGGYVAFALLRLAPNYVQGLVLADTRAEADTPEGVEGRKKMLALLHEKGASAVADDMIPKLLSQSAQRTKPDLVADVRAMTLKNSTAGIEGMITAMMTRPDSTPVLATIHRPTLILVGSDDAATPPAASEKMRGAIPGSELVVIPGAGHLSNLEQPVIFNAALDEFLQKRV